MYQYIMGVPRNGTFGDARKGGPGIGGLGGSGSPGAWKAPLGSKVAHFDGLSEMDMTQELEPISDVYMIKQLGCVDTDPLAPGIICMSLKTGGKHNVFQ